MRIWIVLPLLATCFFKLQAQNSDAVPRTITVAAAANLTDVFREIAIKFEDQTGIKVIYSFGATANLAMQIEHSAPFDVFAAADVEHADALQNKDLLAPDSPVIFARGRLVLWVPTKGNAGITTLEDLKKANVRHVAIANPSLAPYGKAAVQSLKKLEMWEAIEPKVVYAQSINAAKQYAETGNTEAAFTAYALVLHSGGTIIQVAENLHDPLDQSISILAASKHWEDAQAFMNFVLSDQGRAILSRYGYELPAKQ
jgi:molybdate transport system substrate-binding protein